MHLLLGAVGVTDARIDAMRTAMDHLGTGGVQQLLGRGGAWLARTAAPTPVLAHSVADDTALAVIGSAVAARGSDEALRDELSTAGRIRAGTVPELAAVWIDAATGAMVAAAGPGNQGLFIADAPEGGTVVGSNLELVARCVDAAARVDRGAEDFLLGFGFLPGDRTVHPGVRALRGGVLSVGPVGPTPAHAPGAASAPPEVDSFDRAVEVLHDLYMEVIEEQAAGATSHAVLLGGFDSALVGASLRRMGHDVATYTFGFDDPTYEQRNVRVVTRTIGSTEHWVPITPDLIGEGLREFATVFSQPGPQPHYQLHTLAATRQVRDDGFDRVFTGDGCDAVFLGYPTVNTRARLLRRLSRVPDPLSGAALSLMSTRTADRQLGHVARMSRSTLENLRLGTPTGGHLPTRYLDDVTLARLRTGPAPHQDEDVDAIRHRLAAAANISDPIRLAFNGNALTGQSRMKVHGTVGDSGVAQFTPFTHPRITGFVSSLPVEFLRPEGTSAGASGKALLVEMVRRHRLLPDVLIDMPKQSPSDSPIDRWYAGPLRSLVFDMLGALPFEWDRGYVEQIMRPRRIEDEYRRRISIGHQAHQAIGLLVSYASFNRG